MLRYLKKLGRRKEATTREVAKKRLAVVITIDRGSLPPGMLEKLQEDIRGVLSKYPVFDLDHLVIEMQEATGRQRVQIVVPVRSGTS